MKNIYDQLAKGILRVALARVARLETNREIPGHVLVADLWLEPDPEQLTDRDALGVLGRMVASGPSLVEPFSGVPRTTELESCILKQHSLNHARRREAKAAGQPPPPFPRLWVLASGSPDGAIEQLELRQMDGWPSGFMTGRQFDPLHLVVIRKLPKTPDTLLLRLLGRGTFREAVHELSKRPLDTPLSWLAKAVSQVLIEFRRDLDQDQLEEDDMEALRDIEAAYDEWEQRIRSEGRQEGHQAGHREGRQEGRQAALVEAIEALCDVLDISLTDGQRQEMASWELGRLEQVLTSMRSSRRSPWDGE